MIQKAAHESQRWRLNIFRKQTLAGQKYDHIRVVYYPLALFMGCGVIERHLEMAKPIKKPSCYGRKIVFWRPACC